MNNKDTEKKKIMELVHGMFLKEGFHKTTMDEIASELGISKKTIYKHFNSKTDLLDEVTDYFLSLFKEKVAEILDEDIDVLEKYHKISEFNSEQLAKISKRWMKDIKNHAPEVWKRIEKFESESVYSTMQRLIKQGKKEKLIKNYPEELIIAYDIAVARNLMNPEFVVNSGIRLELVLKFIFDVELNGLLTETGRKLYKKRKIKKSTKKNDLNMIKKLILVLMMVFSITGIATSQTVKSFTLEQAVTEAYNNNSELVNARYDKMKADYKVSEAWNEGLIPTVDFSFIYGRYFKKPVINIFGENFEIGSDNQSNVTLQITEPIPILGTPVFQGIKIAEYYSNLTAENLFAVKNKIRADVKKSFLNVLLLKEIVEVNASALKNSQDNLNVVELRYKNGTATEFDYLRAKVKVETIKPNVTQAENNLLLSKKALKNTMGLKTEEDIDVIGRLSYDSLEVYEMSEDELIKKISENNVTIRQLKINKLINEELVNVDRLNYLPKLYLYGQWQNSSNENDDRSFSAYRFNNAITAGIGLNWRFNFFTNSYKKKQSELEVKKNEETIIDVKQKLKIQSQGILLRIEEAKKRIKANYETIKLAERGYELANSSFKNGVVQQIDVLDAELLLTQSKLAYLNSIYDYMSAKSDLEQLLEK